jgi:hypothetical protein
MVDLVGTCPKDFWREWLAEGDCAGELATGEHYSWFTRHEALAKLARIGDRFYVVAHGRLRGWALIAAVVSPPWQAEEWQIVRCGGAVACTIDKHIPGFRGLRKRWWPREAEVPFPDWREP